VNNVSGLLSHFQEASWEIFSGFTPSHNYFVTCVQFVTREGHDWILFLMEVIRETKWLHRREDFHSKVIINESGIFDGILSKASLKVCLPEEIS
jgi:hypothetical protein